MTPARIGFAAAAATLAADQASKLGLIYGYNLPAREPLQLGPFVTFLTAWNKGISYGLFQQDSQAGRWALIGFSLLACLAIAAWILRSTSGLLALSLGLIAGGAAGNTTDRLAFGAVYDFVYLHAGSLSWYVFNLADAAIVAGVVGLVYDAFAPGRNRAEPTAVGPPHESPNNG